jgi:hypothetical protein
MYLSHEDINEQIKWSRVTFGPGTREQGIIDHIKKELKEIEQASNEDDKLEEWIDIIILGIDGAWRCLEPGSGDQKGQKIIGRYLRKMAENFNREWPDWRNFKQNQAIEHVRHDALPSD